MEEYLGSFLKWQEPKSLRRLEVTSVLETIFDTVVTSVWDCMDDLWSLQWCTVDWMTCVVHRRSILAGVHSWDSSGWTRFRPKWTRRQIVNADYWLYSSWSYVSVHVLVRFKLLLVVSIKHGNNGKSHSASLKAISWGGFPLHPHCWHTQIQ